MTASALASLPPFLLERYFARWEFVAPYLLCASDVEGYKLGELLELADDECRALWGGLSLGYTESAGHPLLRREIASLYEGVAPDQVLVFAGAEEAILVGFSALLRPGDHAIVTWPAYQSLLEVARAAGATVEALPLEHESGWRLDTERLERALRPDTRLIVLNAPHNPTGALPTRGEFDRVVELARRSGAWLFADEVYRGLEHDPASRLPAAVDRYEHAVSLGVMSKAYALAGLRIGWLAARDPGLLAEAARIKDYTTICNSAPSEVLALIGLRARERVVARSLAILASNLVQLDRFFEEFAEVLCWVRPRAGAIGFPRLAARLEVDVLAARLAEECGVLLLPGSVYQHRGNHFRLGFGRRNLPEALARFADFLRKHAGV